MLSRLAYLAVWLLFSYPILIGQERLAYRDVESIYGPYYLWINVERWERAEPQWNPFDDLGFPVVADGKSLYWYWPSYLIGWRWASYAWTFQVFLLLHLLLAAATCFELARALGCHPWGAAVASISYAFGGAIYFQLTNPIFLISAAWLPLALLACWKMAVARTVKAGMAASLATGAIAAIMILGGDAQMAYHVWIIAIATTLGAPICRTTIEIAARTMRILKCFKAPGSLAAAVVPSRDNKRWTRARIWSPLVQCSVMSLVTVLLAAAQILPTAEWVALSDRAAFDRPRSILELGQALFRQENIPADSGGGIWRKPVPETHEEYMYRYSQPPWSMWELIWPNFSGSLGRDHFRWSEGLPGGDTIWTPTTYLSAGVFALAIGQFRCWRAARRDRWLSRLALVFGIGSWGGFGAVWFLDAIGLESGLAPALGGVYWLFVVFLPKYVLFRYPAKLFVVAALALVILGGRRFTVLMRQPTGPRLSGGRQCQRQILIFVVWILATVGAFAIFESFGYPHRWLQPAATAHGDIDTETIDRALRTSLFHAAAVWTVMAGWVMVFRRFGFQQFGAGLLMAVVVSIDIYSANSRCIPVESFSVQWGDALERSHRKSMLARIDRSVGLNQDDAIGPKRDHSVEESMSANDPQGLFLASDGRNLSSLLQHWSAPKLVPLSVAPTFSSIDAMSFLAWHETIGRLPSYRVAFFKELSATLPVEFRSLSRRRARETLLRLFDGELVEIPDAERPPPSGTSVPDPALVQIRRFEPNHIVIQCFHREPGWVVLYDLYAPGWQALASSDVGAVKTPVDIRRFQGLFRAVRVEPGIQWLEFHYRPASLVFGGWISRVSWFSLMLAVAMARLAQVRKWRPGHS